MNTMFSHNTQPNTANHAKTKMEDKTTESSMSPLLKGLIIIVVIICVASAVTVAVWLNLAADKKTNDLIDSSITAVLNTTTIDTTTTTIVITTKTSTTSITLPRGTITHQYDENYSAYLACPNSMAITILYAFFGVLSCVSCNCGYCLCPNMTITSTMDTLCTNLTSCLFNVNSTVLGDGCVTYAKTLVVTYYCS